MKKTALNFLSWFFLSGLATYGVSPALAHEFWLEPSGYKLSGDEQLTVSLCNGENFSGDSLLYLPAEFVEFTLRDAGGDYPVESALGEPEPELPVSDFSGLKVLAYESVINQLEHSSYEKFAQYAREEGVEWVLENFREEHDRQSPVRENFRRFAKSLLSVDTAGGTDQPTGMELELVALDNPYMATEKDTLRFQLLYQGKPLAGSQVTVLTKSENRSTQRDTEITNHEGIVTLSKLPGSEYLLNAVHLRPPGLLERFTNGTHWESLWASMTFSVLDSGADRFSCS